MEKDQQAQAAPHTIQEQSEGQQRNLTEVENAHAAGMGAMGRNDEKLPPGAEQEAAAPDEPAY